jgi:hypothetical protein
VLDRRPVGLLDRAQPGGHPPFPGRDRLTVATAVGVLGQALPVPLDLPDVCLALFGVSCHREHGDAGGVLIQDQADRPGCAVAVGHGDDPGARHVLRGNRQALPGPVAEALQHHLCPVDLVACPAEVLTDRTRVGGPAGAVFHQPGGLGPVGCGGRAGADA